MSNQQTQAIELTSDVQGAAGDCMAQPTVFCTSPLSVASRPGALVKRTVDIVAAALGLCVLSPLFAVCAMAVTWDSPGPVLFRQTRVGRYGKPFTLLKFRSMMQDADRQGLKVTAAGDPRVTGVGRWLRATKLDELPQLLNVLRGEMSLVGPRPEVPEYVAGYDVEQRNVLNVRPGITGVASLYYVREEDVLAGKADPDRFYKEHILPRKLEMDLAYCVSATLATDMRVLGSTIARLFWPPVSHCDPG